MTGPSTISASQWRLATRWFERAEGDIRIARAVVTHEPDTLWGAALHCQQAAEKISKGLLIAFGIRPPRTHNIEALTELAALGALTGWYFTARYPSGVDESLSSLTDIRVAIDKIDSVRKEIESLAPKRGA
jgi:HEPN domain-containing protein